MKYQREILFRGKRVDNGEWVEGSLITHSYFGRYDEFLGFIHYITKCIGANGVQVVPETVGQFTGLLDKNGAKIFEGDLVSIINICNDLPSNVCAEIVFSYEYVGGWVAMVDNKTYCTIGIRTHLIEVIGNIHDKTKKL